jgi:uncharacterized cupredoxin-like copper-binding protein
MIAHMNTHPSTFARAASVIAVAAAATILVACASSSPPGWTYMPLPPTSPPASGASASPGASGSPAASATPAASGTPAGSGSANVIELEETSSLQILQNGQPVTNLNVVPGQTYTFRVNNTAGFSHDLYLGPPDKLQSGDVTGLPGVPENSNGVQEFTWTADASATGWQFACTVPGHYTNMHGTLTLGGQ